MLKLIALLFSAVLLFVNLFSMPAWADNAAAKLFELHCAGCHVKGGNIVRRGKTLKLKALEKNGYSSIDAIAQIIMTGKGNMSAYKERLSAAEIQMLAEYVLEQAQQNWH